MLLRGLRSSRRLPEFLGNRFYPATAQKYTNDNVMKVKQALNLALDEELARDKDVFILGEEVGHAGGAYGVTAGLWEKYGDKRVVDTPISEMGFSGLAVGAAFKKLRPIVDFMTWNFAMQAVDQVVNSAAKTLYMSGGTIHCPIVFRGPNGPAPGVAAQHTQDFSSWYAQIPGLKVVAPYNAEDARGLLKAAVRDDNPVVILEDEVLYELAFPVSDAALHKDFTVPIGKAKIEREGGDVTIVAHSMGLHHALQGAEELALIGIQCEVVNLRSLRPFDFETVAKSALKTRKVVIVEVGWPFCGIGAEISSQIMESDVFYHLEHPVRRVTGVDVPTPYNETLERKAFPSAATVVKVVKRIVEQAKREKHVWHGY
ncbi:unnamed protein product [Bursaphelenchus xylophilus]|uniref:Pyruvate dehydrogenase E1 component subunit beta n=1 Tax=Bursaphelenchus xylophilus TaxID=6326 RepID=A0A1I7RX10_BURXY|nr:unnamed protein product [Bursaphelenchus xylophilus]CAG9121252.1 unnamed protein product [Bursaphelenchus xylophilus]